MADPTHLAHLLRRTEFVVRPQRFDALIGGSIAAAVDDVVDIGHNGTPPTPAELAAHSPDAGWQQYVSACTWWLERMLNAPRPLQEKMTLFWHGHFTSSWWDVGRGYHLVEQNQQQRAQALGNFVTLTQTMAVNRAMLAYLSNAENVKSSPNQNFARELLELFTLGVGNYTEGDVEAAMRAWTGHNASWPEYVYEYRPTKHDGGAKTFFGITKDWDGPDIVREIITGSKRLVAAKFLVRKLWEFFAYAGPDDALVTELANVYIAAGYELRPLMAALLKRPEFYSVRAQQGMVRSPAELFVALAHSTGIGFSEMGVAWRGDGLGQALFQPPNVSGWRTNGYWLSTAGLNARAELARGLTWTVGKQPWVPALMDSSADDAVDQAARRFGIHPLSATTRAALIGAHRAERDSVPWRSWWAPINLLTMIMLAPELHMA